MKHRYSITVCILGTLFFTFAHGAEAQRYRFSKPFLDSMLRMMERMGVVEAQGQDMPNAGAGARQSRPALRAAPNARYRAGVPSDDGDANFAFQDRPNRMNPSRAFPYPNRGAQPHPSAVPPQQTKLNGVWEGRSGDLLLINEGYFRVYVDSNRYREGRLHIQKNLLIMYNPRTKATKRYGFALHEGRLALVDDRGELLLYRRKK